MTRRRVDYRWHLRQVMAARGLFATTDLHPLLAERGVDLSAAQVYRLVTATPERLNLRVLAAICDALEVTPADLIEPFTVAGAARTRATGTSGGRPQRATSGPGGRRAGDGLPARPVRAQIVPGPPADRS